MVVDPVAEGMTPGSYKVKVEAGKSVYGCTYLLRSTTMTVHFAHEVSGVAPGQAVAGDTVRVYGRTLTGMPSAYLRIASNPQQTPQHVLQLPVQQDAFVEIEVGSGPGRVPLTTLPGGAPWYLQLANSSAGSGGSTWMPALVVNPAGSAASPLTVTGEEDPSCGGPGTECSHPILPGQTWQGQWHDQAGDSFRVTLASGPAGALPGARSNDLQWS